MIGFRDYSAETIGWTNGNNCHPKAVKRAGNLDPKCILYMKLCLFGWNCIILQSQYA